MVQTYAPRQLVIINGATWEQAMDALAEGTLSHGMCEACAEAVRVRYGLRKETA